VIKCSDAFSFHRPRASKHEEHCFSAFYFLKIEVSCQSQQMNTVYKELIIPKCLLDVRNMMTSSSASTGRGILPSLSRHTRSLSPKHQTGRQSLHISSIFREQKNNKKSSNILLLHFLPQSCLHPSALSPADPVRAKGGRKGGGGRKAEVRWYCV